MNRLERRGRGAQREIARALGVSAKHINDLVKGRTGGSEKLRVAITRFFNEKYEEWLSEGRKILEKEKQQAIPSTEYERIIGAPRDKRFDMIVKIAQREAGCPLVVFDDELRKQYEEWRVTEEEVYREVLKQMKAVKRAMERVDGEM